MTGTLEPVIWPSDIAKVVPLTGNEVTYDPPTFDGTIGIMYVDLTKVGQWQLEGLAMYRDVEEHKTSDGDTILVPRDHEGAEARYKDILATCIGTVMYKGTKYEGADAMQIVVRTGHGQLTQRHALDQQQQDNQELFRLPPSGGDDGNGRGPSGPDGE